MSKTEIATTVETTAAEKFEVINDHFSRGNLPAGILAFVPGRGRVLRWSNRGRNGDEYWGYASIPDDAARAPEILAWPKSEIDQFMAQFEQAQYNTSGGGRLNRFEKSASETEWDRFRQQWPFVAEDLLPRRRVPDRVFDPGALHKHSGYDKDIGSISYEMYCDFRDRHVSGDWGLIGRYDPGVLDDEVATWMYALQPDAFRNAFSIRRGAGVVRSAFALPESRKPDMVMNVATALIPGKEAVTLMLVRHRNQPL